MLPAFCRIIRDEHGSLVELAEQLEELDDAWDEPVAVPDDALQQHTQRRSGMRGREMQYIAVKEPVIVIVEKLLVLLF